MLASEKKIINTYVSANYLSDELIVKKSEEINLLMDHEIKQNSSAFPVAIFHFQSYLFSKNRAEKIPAIVIMIIAFVLPFMGVKRKNMTMYFTASALAGFEIILLLTLQQIIGNMYQLTGLIIAGVMAGLAFGSGLEIKLLNTLSLKTKGIILMTFYIMTGLIYNYLPEFRFEFPAMILLIISAFVPAVLTGNIFCGLTFSSNGQTSASGIYSADLAGSAFGFILLSGITIPAFGIRVSIFILASLIFAGLLFGTIRNK
jgi:hypothetical protein